MANELKINSAWLIYHPPRESCRLRNNIVYHDSFLGNQDPYIWNNPFIHSFCHITQISKEKRQINFWVSRDKKDSYPNFTKLFCDLVFVVKSINPWTNPNSINRHDPIVDNDQAFKHHYSCVNPPNNQHHFKGTKRLKTRSTLKAYKKLSFQPQNEHGNLINIIPFLEDQGIKIATLRRHISLNSKGKKAIPSRPFQLDKNTGIALYNYLNSSSIKLRGDYLSDKHPKP